MTSASSASPSLTNIQPSLQGVKVPDENLTPQQRQHREEQLATIRKMQQMLFPEHQGMRISPEGHLQSGPEGQEGPNPGMGPASGPNIDMGPAGDQMVGAGMPPGNTPNQQLGQNMIPGRPMNMPIASGGNYHTLLCNILGTFHTLSNLHSNRKL